MSMFHCGDWVTFSQEGMENYRRIVDAATNHMALIIENGVDFMFERRHTLNVSIECELTSANAGVYRWLYGSVDTLKEYTDAYPEMELYVVNAGGMCRVMPGMVLKMLRECPEWLRPGCHVRMADEGCTDAPYLLGRVFAVHRFEIDGTVTIDYNTYCRHVIYNTYHLQATDEPCTVIEDVPCNGRIVVTGAAYRLDYCGRFIERDGSFVGRQFIVDEGRTSAPQGLVKVCGLDRVAFPVESVERVTVVDENPEVCDFCGCLFGNERKVQVMYTAGYRTKVVGHICRDCADMSQYVRVCDDCGDVFLHYCVHTDGNTTICERCYQEGDYRTCAGCGSIISPDDSCYDEEDDCDYCSSCYDNVLRDRRDSELVMDYSEKPDPIFHSTADDGSRYDIATIAREKGYFGVELEIAEGDNQHDCAVDLHDIDPRSEDFYMKHDCSIGNNCGIEIVTHPCTLDYHLNRFPWQRIVETARAHDYTSHDNKLCGMHVHVNREFFGSTDTEEETTTAKVIILFDKFWTQMVKFSRRTSEQLHWCMQPCAGINDDDPAEEVSGKLTDFALNASRYHAVNLQNEDTIEFRLFRGTLNLNTIRATLQFVRYVIVFAKDHDLATIQHLTWNEFTACMEDQELLTYMKQRGLLSNADEVSGDVDYDDETVRA